MKSDNTFIYALSGEIDHHKSERIRNEVDEIILSERPNILKFDFSKVRFMDSSGIGLVLGRYRLISSMGGKIIVCGVENNIAKLLRMSGVDKIIEITK